MTAIRLHPWFKQIWGSANLRSANNDNQKFDLYWRNNSIALRYSIKTIFHNLKECMMQKYNPTESRNYSQVQAISEKSKHTPVALLCLDEYRYD